MQLANIFSCCFQASPEDPFILSSYNCSSGSKQQSAPKSSNSVLLDLTTLQTPPNWQDESAVHTCMQCHITQFDIFHRKHHCRACGQVCCNPCASIYRLSLKYQWQIPQRICQGCAPQIDIENSLFGTYLPLLKLGNMFLKHGIMRKRMVKLQFIPTTQLFQYQNIDVITRECEGDVKAISLQSVLEVQELSAEKSSHGMGFVLRCNDQEHRFETNSKEVQNQWVSALRSMQNLRHHVRTRQLENQTAIMRKEHEDMIHTTRVMNQIEAKKALMIEERLRKRAAQRKLLREKYQTHSPPLIRGTVTKVA